MKILVSLAGMTSLELTTWSLKQQFDYVVGVDGGMDRLVKAGITTDLICGDFDSTATDINVLDCEVVQFPIDKDKTDFALTLDYLQQKFSTIPYQIEVIGFNSCLRLDHYQANLNLIEPYIKFVDRHTEITTFLPGTYTHDYSDWEYISFFAQKPIPNLEISGLRYNYNDSLLVGSNQTVCNIPDKTTATISFDSGKLLQIVSREHE